MWSNEIACNPTETQDEYERRKHQRIAYLKKTNVWVDYGYDIHISFNRGCFWMKHQKHSIIAMLYNYMYLRTKFSDWMETKYNKIVVVAPFHRSEYDERSHLTIYLVNNTGMVDHKRTATPNTPSKMIHVKSTCDKFSNVILNPMRIVSMTFINKYGVAIEL